MFQKSVGRDGGDSIEDRTSVQISRYSILEIWIICVFFCDTKTPNLYGHVGVRVQNHSFDWYWTKPRSPITRKRLKRTLQNVIASFSSFDFSVTFPHVPRFSFSPTLRSNTHKEKWTIRNEERRVYGFLYWFISIYCLQWMYLSCKYNRTKNPFRYSRK